jgi:hypothetical protein
MSVGVSMPLNCCVAPPGETVDTCPDHDPDSQEGTQMSMCSEGFTTVQLSDRDSDVIVSDVVDDDSTVVS